MKAIKRLYCIITSIIVFGITILIFSVYHFSVLRSIALLIISLVIFDILCTIFEALVSKIRKAHVKNKLKRIEKKGIKLAEHMQKKSASKKMKENMKKISKNPDYKKVLDSEAFIEKLKKLSDDYNFGVNKAKIDICITRLSEIISILKNDCSGYSRVSFLFESYLPEFHNTLMYYSEFIRADIVDIEQEKTLNKCVDKFLVFLQSQKIEALLDRTETEIHFNVSAENLMQIIDE